MNDGLNWPAKKDRLSREGDPEALEVSERWGKCWSKGRLFWKANFAKPEKFSESKSLLLWIARIRGRPLDFLNTCPLQVYFCIISWLQTCYLNKRLQNECIAEKNWRSKVELLDVCFLQKMLSRPKDRSFTPPENLPGEGLKHTYIREKRRFSAFG